MPEKSLKEERDAFYRLLDIGMDLRTADRLAQAYSYSRLCRAAEAAKGKANPAGWAFMALTQGWKLPLLSGHRVPPHPERIFRVEYLRTDEQEPQIRTMRVRVPGEESMGLMVTLAEDYVRTRFADAEIISTQLDSAK